jgi:hypothetical protein
MTAGEKILPSRMLNLTTIGHRPGHLAVQRQITGSVPGDDVEGPVTSLRGPVMTLSDGVRPRHDSEMATTRQRENYRMTSASTPPAAELNARRPNVTFP